MNRICLNRALFSAVALVLSACHKQKQDPVVELEKVASAMTKSAPAPAASDASPGPVVGGPPPANQVQDALADYKAGKMEDAVTRLQLLRNMPALTPQQRMALQDSVAAVMTEVYTLAAKGDPRAIAAVKRYEQMQNRR